MQAAPFYSSHVTQTPVSIEMTNQGPPKQPSLVSTFMRAIPLSSESKLCEDVTLKG